MNTPTDLDTSNKIVQFGDELRTEAISTVHRLIEGILLMQKRISSPEEYRVRFKGQVEGILAGRSPQDEIDDLRAQVIGLKLLNE